MLHDGGQNKQPVVEYASVMRVLFEKDISDILKLASTTQESILIDLDRDYADELSDGHKASFLDPHKERHAEKVRLAHELKAACMKKIVTLSDISRFFRFYKQIVQHNHEIDPKGNGHTLGKLLARNERHVEELHGNLYPIHRDMQYFNNHIHGIILNLLALEKEEQSTSAHRNKKPHDEYHEYQIETYTKLLADLLKRKDNDDIDEVSKLRKAQEKAHQIYQSLLKDLLLVEGEARREAKNRRTNESTVAADILQAKVNLLEKYSRHYVDEVFILDIQGREEIKDRIELLARDNVQLIKFLLFELTVREFAPELIVEEKRSLWKASSEVYNNIGVSAGDGAGKDRLNQWCMDCYRETFGEMKLSPEQERARQKMLELENAKREEEELKRIIRDVQANRPDRPGRSKRNTNNSSSIVKMDMVNFRDALSTTELTRNLKSIVSSAFDSTRQLLPVEKINLLINAMRDSHISTMLRKIKDKCMHQSIYNERFLEVWQDTLIDMFGRLTRRLSLVNDTVEKYFNNSLPGNLQEDEKSIIHFIQYLQKAATELLVLEKHEFVTDGEILAAKKVSIKDFLKPKQVSLSSSGLGLFAGSAPGTNRVLHDHRHDDEDELTLTPPSSSSSEQPRAVLRQSGSK